MRDDDDGFSELVDAFVYNQGSTMALNFILMEVVRHLARQSGNPEKLLAHLYDDVYARLDNEPVDQPRKQANLYMHEVIDRFFSNARKWSSQK